MMQAIFESIFDVLYLVGVITAGILMVMQQETIQNRVKQQFYHKKQCCFSPLP